MGLKDPRVGYNSVNEFMGSGLPWVISNTASSTVIKHSFDKITRHIKISNHAASGVYLRVGFTQNGIAGAGDAYYYKVNGGDSFEIDARIKDIYVVRDSATDAAYSLYAELTMIDSDMMPVLTGSLGGTAFWNGVG